MPAGIDTPGFLEEEKEKPAVTKKIEESDDQISPEKCAEYLIAGESQFSFPHLFSSIMSFCLSCPFPFQLLHISHPFSRRPYTDNRCREGVLSIHLPPYRGVNKGGLEGFSTGQ